MVVDYTKVRHPTVCAVGWHMLWAFLEFGIYIRIMHGKYGKAKINRYKQRKDRQHSMRNADGRIIIGDQEKQRAGC